MLTLVMLLTVLAACSGNSEGNAESPQNETPPEGADAGAGNPADLKPI
ncbi:hypothetical protein P4H39_31275 [Paenibacillus lautus]|nr:hypothetical protein [Paenibacillus lautus]MEC0207094.1 hypothetical protein [Paenibacillus lautus]